MQGTSPERTTSIIGCSNQHDIHTSTPAIICRALQLYSASTRHRLPFCTQPPLLVKPHLSRHRPHQYSRHTLKQPRWYPLGLSVACPCHMTSRLGLPAAGIQLTYMANTETDHVKKNVCKGRPLGPGLACQLRIRYPAALHSHTIAITHRTFKAMPASHHAPLMPQKPCRPSLSLSTYLDHPFLMP